MSRITLALIVISGLALGGCWRSYQPPGGDLWRAPGYMGAAR